MTRLGLPTPRAVLVRMVPWVGVPLVLVGLWEILYRLAIWPPYLFPGPGEAAASLVDLWNRGLLVRGLAVSLYRLATGFLFSLLLGGLLAFAMVHFRALGTGLQPYVLGLQTFPSIAWVPLAILWFGFSDSALTFVTIMGSLFAVTIAFVDALRTVPPTYIRAARSMGSEGSDLILRVVMPAALPYLIAASKQGWSFAWRSLIGAEIVFAAAGLGFLLNQGREFLDTSQVVAMMVTILVLGIVVDRGVFSWLQAWAARGWGLTQR